MDRLVQDFKKRWKFLAVTYILGYIFTLYMTGLPNVYYLQPIKVMALLISLTMGNLFYQAYVEKPNQIRIFYLSIIYGVPLCVLFIATVLLQKWLNYCFQIDVGIITGVPIHPR